MFDPLRPFFYIRWIEDKGLFHVAKLEHRTRGTFRVAYFMKNGRRPRLSPECGEQTADLFVAEANRDYRWNLPATGLKHRIRIYAREVMPFRWKKHRKIMAARKEARQLENLPQFGMF